MSLTEIQEALAALAEKIGGEGYTIRPMKPSEFKGDYPECDRIEVPKPLEVLVETFEAWAENQGLTVRMIQYSKTCWHVCWGDDWSNNNGAWIQRDYMEPSEGLTLDEARAEAVYKAALKLLKMKGGA